MIRFIFSLIFIGLLNTASVSGQSLFQDTENLLSALQLIQEAQQDSNSFRLTNATARTLAILQNYDQSVLTDTISTTSFDNLLQNYSDNQLVLKALQENNFSLSDSLPTEVYLMFQQWKKVEQSGPRQKILSLLQAEQVVSPRNYLSVGNSLDKYSLPPLKNVDATQLAAQNSNANINNGILNATAVIQGLFEFVLDRAKDEVVINYLDRMLNEDSPEFSALFPTVIEQFSKREFTYSNSFIQRLRQAFYQDIQQLSVNLPDLFLTDDYFLPLQSEPVAYNFLALYSMIGMSINDVPVEEIMPITHRYLFKSYEETGKEVNFTLADEAFDKPEYEDLVNLTTAILNRIKAIYIEMDQVEFDLRNEVNATRNNFSDGIAPPAANHYLQKKAYDLDVLLGENTGPEYDLSLLPSLLRGRLDSTYILGANTLSSYDKYFGKSHDPRQWRAAGLAIARNLNGTWYQDLTMADILYAWQQDLAKYRLEIDRWKNTIDPDGALQQALEKADADRTKLANTIRANKSFWNDRLSYDEGLAHDLLTRIVSSFEDIEDDPKYEDMEEAEANLAILTAKQSLLLAVETRLVDLDKRLKEKHPEEQRASAIDTYLASRDGLGPYNYLIAQIDELAKSLKNLDQQLQLVDSTYARPMSRARDNARPVLQTTEFATQLLYGLRSNNEEEKWITKVELDSMMDGGIRQNIFLGLLMQRLSKVKDVQLFSPTGIAQLVELSVADLPTLPKYQETDSLVTVDSLAFFHRAAFVVNTLNRMLELPLLTSPTDRRNFTPLKDQIPGMANVPDIANQTLDFIYFVNVKDHRHAVSSMLRLFSFLETDVSRKMEAQGIKLTPSKGKKELSKRKTVISYLQKYGDFIADLIDAEEGQQVEDLLNNIADPPGSSRIKRTQQLTVGLNAYLGGNVGWERWTNSRIVQADDGYVSLAPSIPVGISISRLFGPKKRSFSLFISFLDLGGLLTLRPDSDTFGEPELNFRNVFKPGLQVQYNIPKSPFYLALGGQYGPQVLGLTDDTNVSYASTRLFFGFGVDVPIKTFFQK